MWEVLVQEFTFWDLESDIDEDGKLLIQEKNMIGAVEQLEARQEIVVVAISFGPEDVYFIIGKNKITEDYDSAMFRARNVAAPLNAKRLQRKTPCAINGDKCFDCNSPDRICRNFVVFKTKPCGARYHVILINEDLGY